MFNYDGVDVYTASTTKTTIGGEKVYKFENSYSVGQNIWPYAYTKDIAFVNGNNYTMSYDI